MAKKAAIAKEKRVKIQLFVADENNAYQPVVEAEVGESEYAALLEQLAPTSPVAPAADTPTE